MCCFKLAGLWPTSSLLQLLQSLSSASRCHSEPEFGGEVPLVGVIDGVDLMLTALKCSEVWKDF